MGILQRARTLVTVEPVLFLYMLGSFLQYSSVQQLLQYKVCIIKYNNTDLCENLAAHDEEEKEVTKQASHWLIILNIALTFPSIVSSLFLGSWSDRVGRKAIILLPAIGSILYGTVLIISAEFVFLPVWVIVVGQAVLGFTGAYSVLTSAVFSYMGDITTIHNRTKRFGILEGMTFVGSFVGFITSGIVIDKFSYTAVFIYYVACNFLLLLYVIVWLRESNTNIPQQNSDFSTNVVESLERSVENDLGRVGRQGCCTELFRFENVKNACATVFRERPYKHRKQLVMLVMCLFTFELVGTGERDTTVYYIKKEPLNFTATQTSFYLGGKSLFQSIALLLGMPLLHLVHMSDPCIAMGGTTLRVGGYVMMAFARTATQLYSVIFFLAFAGLPAASTRAMMSKIVAPVEQGSLFSFMAAIETLTGFLGSFIFNSLYPATEDILEGGFVFLVMAALLVIPVILLVWVRDLQRVELAYQLHAQEEGKERHLHGDT